jgi:hypothetical protein
VENCTIQGRSFINLRADYGSTWEGTIVIRDSRWLPGCGDKVQPYLINVSNDGLHDFGYPCFMPQTVVIDGLTIDDGNHPEGYAGPYLFTDPDGSTPTSAARPHPYRPTEHVTIRRLTTASGLKVRTSPDAVLAAQVRVDGAD